MNTSRAFPWFVLLLALAACTGAPAAPTASTTGTTATPGATSVAPEPAASVTFTAPVVVPSPVVTQMLTAPMPTPVTVVPSPTLAPSPTLVPSPTMTFTPTLPPTLPPTAMWTATPLPTATATATATFTPTVRLATNPYELGEPDMLDPMDVPGKAWYVWGNPYVRPRVEPGRLVLIVDKTSEVTYWIRSTYPPLEDAYVEAIFWTGRTCHHKDRYGLGVRSPVADEGYFFVISCDGMYKIFRWNGGLKILQDWDRTTAIHTGGRQTNRVGVWMEGTTMRLFVNNTLVAEVEDDKFTQGTFGLLVGADATPGFEVAVDQVAYWMLPQPAATP